MPSPSWRSVVLPSLAHADLTGRAACSTYRRWTRAQAEGLRPFTRNDIEVIRRLAVESDDAEIRRTGPRVLNAILSPKKGQFQDAILAFEDACAAIGEPLRSVPPPNSVTTSPPTTTCPGSSVWTGAGCTSRP